MGYILGNSCQVSMIDSSTGKEIRLGKVKDYSFTVEPEHKNQLNNNYAEFKHEREINFTCNNVKLFPNELGKLHYMKTHVKSKRLKKKYNKLFTQKYNRLINKFFFGL